MDTRIVTKMKIQKRPEDVLEALVDPAQMSHYWFSSGTHRIEPGTTIIWRYEEYNAEGKVHVKEVEEPRKIQFIWGEEPRDNGNNQLRRTG